MDYINNELIIIVINVMKENWDNVYKSVLRIVIFFINVVFC